MVDDFCPAGSVSDVQRYHKEADRLFRGQGNRAGRQRLRADASLRPATLVIAVTATAGPYEGRSGTVTFLSRSSPGSGVFIAMLNPLP